MSESLFRCAVCNASGTPDVFAATAASRELGQWLLAIPHGLMRHVLRYLALFRSGNDDLCHVRAIDLLEELVGVMTKGELQFQLQTYRIPPAAWLHAFDQMHAQRKTISQLKGHAFLWRVVTSVAKDFDETAEREREINRRSNRPASNEMSVVIDEFERRLQIKANREHAKNLRAMGQNEAADVLDAQADKMENRS